MAVDLVDARSTASALGAHDVCPRPPPAAQHAAPRYGLRLGADRDERGASAVEYGLLVAGIAAVIVGSVFVLGQGVFVDLFTKTCNSIGQNMGSTC